MAELATIARPYAEALFKAAQADLNAVSVWLDELAEIGSNPDLRQFASNPNSTVLQVLDLIGSVMKAALPEQGKNFLRTVIENGRFTALPEIAAQFRVLKNASRGVEDATVYSAFPIEASALADVATVIEKRFNRKLNLEVKQDAGLIGGIRVVVGDEVLDTSLKSRLEQMKVALTA